jgi:hypothetical protein
MKTLITTLLVFTYWISFCQDHISPYKLNDNGRLYFDSIYLNESISKEEIYTRSKTWIAKAFKDAKEVNMHSDKEEGLIIGKGSVMLKANALDIMAGSYDYLRYTINIFCKDGRAKIVIDDIGFFSIGSKIEPVTPLENMYWMYGNTSKKIRTGWTKDKQKKADAIRLIASDWAKALESEKAGYSDF